LFGTLVKPRLWWYSICPYKFEHAQLAVSTAPWFQKNLLFTCGARSWDYVEYKKETSILIHMWCPFMRLCRVYKRA
jgi:hypothetical protein